MARNTVIVSVLADTKQFAKGMKGADSALGKLANVGKTAVKTVGAIGAALAGLAIAGGFSRALKMDEAKTQLKALGYTAEQVTGIMDSALASVKGTAFGLDSAATIAAQALASGVPEGERLTAALTTVANTAALAKVGMDEMGSIFSKVWANNKVTTQEMNQLADRGVPIWQYLSEAFGVSNAELRKMIEAGEVTAEMFEGALGPAVEGMATAMSGSFKGLLANAQAALSRLGAMFATPVLEAGKGALSGFTEAIDLLAEKLKPAADAFAEFLSGIDLGAVIGDFIKFVDAASPIAEVAAYFSPIGVALKLLSPLLPPLMDAFTTLGDTLGGAIATILPVLADLFQQVALALVPLLGPVLELATTIATALVPVIEAIAPLLTLIVETFVALLPAIMPIIEAVFALLEPILALVEPIMSLVSTVIPMLVEAFNAILGVVLPVIQTLVEGLLPVIEGITAGLTALIDFITAVFQGDWEAAWAAIVAGFEASWQTALAVLQAIWNTIVSFITGIVSRILNMILSWGAGIYNAVNSAWKGALNFFQQLPAKIGGFMSGAINWLVSAGRNIIDGLINGLNAAAGAVGETLLNIVKGAVDGFLSFLGIASPSRLFKGFGRNIGQGLAIGMQQTANLVSAAADGLSGAVTSGFGSPELELANSVRLTGSSASRPVYNVTVQALAPSPEIGRAVTEAIADYERIGGGR